MVVLGYVGIILFRKQRDSLSPFVIVMIIGCQISLKSSLLLWQKKGCVLSYTSYMTCDENGDMKGIVVCRNTESFFSSKCNNGIGCLTAMYDVRKMGKIFMPTIRKKGKIGGYGLLF